LIISTDNSADVQPPYPILVLLIVAKLTKRYPKLCRPGRVLHIDMRPPLPYCIPAEVDRQLIRYRYIRFISTKIDIELRSNPIVMIGIEGTTDQSAIAVIVA